ncbi:hypothetical protein BASA82_001284 [Batrachochytrium salamandrivorans]|nr:hypothetical protein BASA81_005196 [Batrachochytrium salamandrivorans]KAH9259196.1 hypothetical protein BASA82_001284 [Batrachochytrium salamandrivorans]
MARTAAPVKIQQQDVSGDTQALNTIIAYLHKQNRPYNSTDIFNNLKGSISKTCLLKILSLCTEQQLIQSKTYGKSVIYAPIQYDETPDASDKVATTASALELANKDLVMHRETLKTLTNELAKLSKSLPTCEAKAKLDQINQRNDLLTRRLEILSNGKCLASPEQCRDISSRWMTYRHEWRRRQKWFNTAWQQIFDGSREEGINLMATIGIERDEDVGVKFDE